MAALVKAAPIAAHINDTRFMALPFYFDENARVPANCADNSENGKC